MTTQAFYNHVAYQDYVTLKPLWNEYVAETGNGEEIFYNLEALAETFEFKAIDLARMVFFGELDAWGDDVYINCYGNVASCWSVDSSPICIEELAEWLEESNHEFYQSWESEQEEESEE